MFFVTSARLPVVTPFHGHQCVFVGLAVERALARDGDVFAFEGVDQRRVVHQLDAFPAREARAGTARDPG